MAVTRCAKFDSDILDWYENNKGTEYVLSFIMYDNEMMVGVKPDCPEDLRQELVKFFFDNKDIFADQNAVGGKNPRP